MNGSTHKIASVHLLGATVDDEEVSKNPQDILTDLTNENTVKYAYGDAIEGQVIKFYNLFDSEDNLYFNHFHFTNIFHFIPLI